VTGAGIDQETDPNREPPFGSDLNAERLVTALARRPETLVEN
jgi:hypothetical protein